MSHYDLNMARRVINAALTPNAKLQMNIAFGIEAPISARIIPAIGKVVAAKKASELPVVSGNTIAGMSAQMNDATAHGEQ